MSSKASALEDEIARMQDRLAIVKVVVAAEKEAWKSSYKTGKHGTKWKGAARTSTPPTPSNDGTGTSKKKTSEEHLPDTIDLKLVIPEGEMPIAWDALELGQWLYTQHLQSCAQVIVHEKINGQVLLETSPGNLRKLFKLEKNNPTWKQLLQVASFLQKHYQTNKKGKTKSGSKTARFYAGTGLNDPEDESFFPKIPSTRRSNSENSKSSTGDSSIEILVGKQEKKSAVGGSQHPQPAVGRKPSNVSVNGPPLATCWNCGARFPKSSQVASKVLATRTFCSQQCQVAIEKTDMFIHTASSSGPQLLQQLHQQQPSFKASGKTPPSHLLRQKARTFQDKKQLQADIINSLHVDASSLGNGLGKQQHIEALAAVPSQQQQQKKKSIIPGPAKATTTTSTGRIIRGVTLPRVAPPFSLVLEATLQGSSATSSTNPASTTKTPRGVGLQSSMYKLDPNEMSGRSNTTFHTCFHVGSAKFGVKAASHGYQKENLLVLASYLNVRSLYHWSLTCQSWFDILNMSPSTSDLIWQQKYQNAWGLLDTKTPGKARKKYHKLIRNVSKLVLENLKILVQPDTWQLATTCRTTPKLSQCFGSHIVSALKHRLQEERAQELGVLYEQITLIYEKENGLIVAIRAQELIRPIMEETSMMDILQGLKKETLVAIECRRLRIFSLSNRLPFDQWKYLLVFHPGQCFFPVVELFTTLQRSYRSEQEGEDKNNRLVDKILSQTMKQYHKKLTSKDSLHQIIKYLQERNAPQETMDSFEQFQVSIMMSGRMRL